jgi:hypothetical protein
MNGKAERAHLLFLARLLPPAAASNPQQRPFELVIAGIEDVKEAVLHGLCGVSGHRKVKECRSG